MRWKQVCPHALEEVVGTLAKASGSGIEVGVGQWYLCLKRQPGVTTRPNWHRYPWDRICSSYALFRDT